MPFVHFPADAALEEAAEWRALRSRSQRTPLSPRATRAEKLRGESVCAYAGPCCYAPKRAVGVVALYFKPDIDQTKGGATTPFDSGALTEREPCLQPWAARVRAGTMSVDQCVDFVEKHSLPLAGWRAPFQSWLQHCYADPMRYLETTDDSWNAGVPDRTRPVELATHNGAAGRAKSKRRCADRRAWTWETRFSDALEYEHLLCVHAAADSFEDALAAFSCRIRTLPPGVAAGAKALYLHSGSLLAELTA